MLSCTFYQYIGFFFVHIQVEQTKLHSDWNCPSVQPSNGVYSILQKLDRFFFPPRPQTTKRTCWQSSAIFNTFQSALAAPVISIVHLTWSMMKATKELIYCIYWNIIRMRKRSWNISPGWIRAISSSWEHDSRHKHGSTVQRTDEYNYI